MECGIYNPGSTGNAPPSPCIEGKWDIVLSPDISELFASDCPVAIGVSGGKDSHAVSFRTNEYLDEIGHKGSRLLVHSDLGRIEWRDSLPTCERIARALNLQLVVLRRKAGDMVDRWEARWGNNLRRYQSLSCVKLILPWSTPSMRFCTSELKTSQICSHLISLFPGRSIVSVTGIRAQESAARAHAQVSSIQKKLQTKGRVGWDWRPILQWSLQDVLSYLHQQRQVLHEAYTKYGCSRVSCSFCIMASEADLKAAASCGGNEAAYRLLVELEARSAFAFQGNRWLGDIAPHLLSPETREALREAKERARKRVEAEAVVPKDLLYAKGWPQRLPSLAEAELLGKVRQTVSETIGLPATFTTAEEIIARYRSLLAQRPPEATKRPRVSSRSAPLFSFS